MTMTHVRAVTCHVIFHMLLKHAMNFEVCHLACDLLRVFSAVVVVFFAIMQMHGRTRNATLSAVNISSTIAVLSHPTKKKQSAMLLSCV